jgi:hypothetical protein
MIAPRLLTVLFFSAPLCVKSEWISKFTLSIIKAKIPGFEVGAKPDTQVGVAIYSQLGQAFLDLFQYRTEIIYGDSYPAYNVNIVYVREKSEKQIAVDDTLEIDILDRGVVIHRAAFQLREFLDAHYNRRIIEYSFRRADNGLKGILYFKMDLCLPKNIVASVIKWTTTTSKAPKK